MYPAFHYYKINGGLSQATVNLNKYAINIDYLLGNMGFSRTTCVSSYVELDTTKVIGCNETGMMSELSYYGLIPNNTPGWDIKGSEYDNAYAFCGSSDSYP